MNLTKNQQMVFDLLQNEHRPHSAYDLLDQLRDEGIRAPSQVYRALKRLRQLGLVHRVESLNAFIACHREHEISQSMLAICDRCGQVEELASLELTERLKKLGDRRGFVPREIVVELKGHCSDCS